eukprot:scaffold7149_cov54-Phaeocystis_antarctica.AAC.6
MDHKVARERTRRAQAQSLKSGVNEHDPIRMTCDPRCDRIARTQGPAGAPSALAVGKTKDTQ